MHTIEMNVSTGETRTIEFTPDEVAAAEQRAQEIAATARAPTLDDVIAVLPQAIRDALSERLRGK